MKTILEQVLERNLNGREIAVWGTPTRLLLRLLIPYKFHIANQVNPKLHFVVAVNDDDLTDFLMDEQSEQFSYLEDYFTLNSLDGEFPFEWECHGVKIGKETYFGKRFEEACEYGYVESIGHFTSINKTAMIQADHQMNMMFSSDDIQNLFTNENLELYRKLKLAGPKYNKYRVKVGNDVWIGANAFINCSRVKNIGDGAIIGAGAVVLEDVPPYAIVVGVPAKIKRYRYEPDVIDALLRVKWWDWSVEEINASFDALASPEIFMQRFGNK